MRIFAIVTPAIRCIPPASGMPLLSGLKGKICADPPNPRHPRSIIGYFYPMENYIIDQQVTGKIYNPEDIMYKDFERCTFTQCDFTACNFTGVAFIDCNFISCNFSESRINYVGLRGAFFDNCNFTGVNFSMVDPLLFGVEFKNCRLDYAKFYTLKIKGTVFTDCSIIAADFMNTDMTEVLFDNCNLHKSVFHDTIAQKADFTTSYNFSIDPERNKLRRARFSQDGLKGLLEKYEIIVVD